MIPTVIRTKRLFQSGRFVDLDQPSGVANRYQAQPMRRQIPIAGCFAMVLVAAGGGLLWAAEPGSTKTDYPNRAITIIVPYAPGGPSDTLSRIVASHWSSGFTNPRRGWNSGAAVTGARRFQGHTSWQMSQP